MESAPPAAKQKSTDAPPKRAFGEKPAPKNKPVAPSKPSGSGPTKAPGPVKVEEEDLGAGLSVEEAIEKCESFYSSEVISEMG